MVTRRILHLIPTFEGGGAERQLGYLAAGLVELDWDVHVGHVGGGTNLERVRAAGATLHRLEAASFYDPRIVGRIARLIRSVGPCAVQTWLPTMDIVGGPAALATGVPWIVSERNDSAFALRRGKIWVRRQLARGAAAIVSNSSAGNAYWSRRVGERRCRVIPNALPLDEIASTPTAKRATFGLPEEVPLLLYVGRLDPQKNIATLLDALEQVLAERDARVLLCGQGPLQAEVEARIARGALRGRAHAPGFVPEAWGWMKAADLLVSVSRWEGMPNTVMEAMAAGCPVVVSDIANHREIVDPPAARFAPADDATAIADAIRASLDDPDREARVEAARRQAQRWSIPAIARRWSDFYAEIAADASSPARGSAQA